MMPTFPETLRADTAALLHSFSLHFILFGISCLWRICMMIAHYRISTELMCSRKRNFTRIPGRLFVTFMLKIQQNTTEKKTIKQETSTSLE